MASRFRMVRSPPKNGSLTGSGRGEDSRKERTLEIFIAIQHNRITEKSSRE
jgi:hypothetical protein